MAALVCPTAQVGELAWCPSAMFCWLRWWGQYWLRWWGQVWVRWWGWRRYFPATLWVRRWGLLSRRLEGYEALRSGLAKREPKRWRASAAARVLPAPSALDGKTPTTGRAAASPDQHDRPSHCWGRPA